ncbi:hypothetical protein IAU60_001064 [Kwoniella sp. DSM 27419]
MTPPLPPNVTVPPRSSEQTRGYSSHARSPPPRRRDFTPTPPPLQLPSAEYIKLSQPSAITKNDHVVPKLLVLDLNGALVYRNRGADLRKSYPRPYLQCFLEYLFLPDPSSPGPHPWEVFVWSSAQPHNVRGMVEGTFGPRWIEGIWEEETVRGREAREGGEGRLLGVWARDKMGLAAGDYSRKVQTTKDLRKVLDHLSSSGANSAGISKSFDEKTVVLLDDSPLKAVRQPFNQLVIPEYEEKLYQEAKAVVSRAEVNDTSTPNDMDETLLAVIGILDSLKKVDNVPAWVRAGGLNLERNSEAHKVELEHLPAHADFVHWYQDPKLLSFWVSAGKKALQARSIELRHGIEADRNYASSPRDRASERRSSTPPHRVRSPSRWTDKPSRSFSTAIHVDADELPDPDQGSQAATSAVEPQAADVARDIKQIIARTTSLSLKQREKLLAARSILLALAQSTDPSMGAGSAVEPAASDHGKPSVGIKTKKARFDAEYAAAQTLQPELTRAQFKAARHQEMVVKHKSNKRGGKPAAGRRGGRPIVMKAAGKKHKTV